MIYPQPSATATHLLSITLGFFFFIPNLVLLLLPGYSSPEYYIRFLLFHNHPHHIIWKKRQDKTWFSFLNPLTVAQVKDENIFFSSTNQIDKIVNNHFSAALILRSAQAGLQRIIFFSRCIGSNLLNSTNLILNRFIIKIYKRGNKW